MKGTSLLQPLHKDVCGVTALVLCLVVLNVFLKFQVPEIKAIGELQ